MRLEKPRIQHVESVYLEPGDPFCECAPETGYGFNAELLLPLSLGSVYVGEVFRAYISLHNDSAAPVKNVVVKLELVTRSQKVVLLDNQASPIAQFLPGANHDFTVEYYLTEGDGHTLSCMVQYADDHSLDVQRLRKTFKFPVLDPFNLKSVKIFTLADHVYVTLELENKATTPISLTSVRLEPASGPEVYTVKDHSTHNQGAVCFEPLNPGEMRRFLLELESKGGARATPKAQMVALGKIQLEWRTHMGECGQIATTAIQHRGLERKQVDLVDPSPEGQVRLQTSFKLKGELKNNLERALNAVVVLNAERLHPFLFSGPSRVRLPTIQPGESAPVEVELVPLCTGVQGVSGISIRDADADGVLWEASPGKCTVLVEK